jgi:hypothetical protein
MSELQFEIPILFLVFNRPELTEQVFSEIQKLKPSKIYISADGPRDNRPGERNKCDQVRRLVSKIDWPCNASFRFLEKNLGCKLAVSSALEWLFASEEFGIVLEDDCLPNPSFFNFCKENIYNYMSDNRIMCISGNNFQNGNWRGDGSYYFSGIPTIWGWATWKRSWCLWDGALQNYPVFRDQKLIKTVVSDKKAQKFWIHKFEDVFVGRNRSTWGFPWVFTVMMHNGLCITPNKNLVTNIGFGPDGTHGRNAESRLACLPNQFLKIDRHPSCVTRDINADNFFSLMLAGEDEGQLKRWLRLVKWHIKKFWGTWN